MTPRLHLARFDELPLSEVLGLAPAALRAAEALGEPVLVTSLLAGGGAVLGALQRREGVAGKPSSRSTTGPRAWIAAQALHHAFALPWLGSLAPDATPRNLLNRYIRGFLRGYSKLGVPAQYFGREYFCLARRPCGLIGYDVTAGGALLLELFVGLDAPVLEPSDAKERPVSLFEALGKNEPHAFVASIHAGLAAKWSLEFAPITLEPEAPPSLRDALGDYVRRRVPIGWLEATAIVDDESAVVRLAGDILCSRAAVEAVESRATAALLAGRDVDDSVLAPLADGPLDGATVSDVQAVLQDAFRRARAAQLSPP
jgi:hypothetical protein